MKKSTELLNHVVNKVTWLSESQILVVVDLKSSDRVGQVSIIQKNCHSYFFLSLNNVIFSGTEIIYTSPVG